MDTLLAVANHLWQSTLCAGVVWALTLVLGKNRAAVRFRLWLAVSVKFLLPFAWFVTLGSQLGWRTVPVPARLPWSVTGDFSLPFVVPAAVPPEIGPMGAVPMALLVYGIWFCGIAISILFWLRAWRLARAVRRGAAPLALHLPIPALSSAAVGEPGIFGIRHPVLLLPEGIVEQLPPAQFDAILAHEMCHVRRRDNLAGAIHLVVESIFWFHPLVWWIRARLVEERERACDEAVLQSGIEPEDYAEGILNVCRFYVGSPLLCVSGIAGGDLSRRIERIVSTRIGTNLNWGRKLLLATVGIAAAGGPVAIDVLHAQQTRVQSEPSESLSFEVASVKANKSGSERAPSMILPGGRFTATNNTVRSLILNAYGISSSPYLLEGGPGWIDSARYDIEAKATALAIPAGTPNRVLWEKTRLMLRTLLADRFKLSIRRETKEMPGYQLVVGKNGPKLSKSDMDCGSSVTACHGFSGNPTRLTGTAVDMYDLASIFGSYSDRPIVDRTGVTGLFDIKLQWNPFTTEPPRENDVPRSPAAEAREGPRPDLSTLPTLFGALEQQLGLRLEAHKGPVEIYVIERVERPSEN
jgi:uncharacterized protein (TIGR03435 family)